MSIAPEKTHVTLEELLASPDAGRFEIVNGQLEEVHVSTLSSDVGGALFARLRMFCEAHPVGRAFPADTYFQCFGGDESRSRKPDASFLSQERLPPDWQAQSYFTIAPDLAVEVLSPNDTAYEVDRKIQDYRKAGVKLIWEINPQLKTAFVYRLDHSVQELTEHDVLSGESVVPGFQCPLREIFP